MKTTPLCVRKLIPALLHAHLKHGQVSDGVSWGEGTFGEQNEDTSMGKDAVCLISVSGNRVGRWMPELGGGGAGRRKGPDSQAGSGEHYFFFPEAQLSFSCRSSLLIQIFAPLKKKECGN